MSRVSRSAVTSVALMLSFAQSVAGSLTVDVYSRSDVSATATVRSNGEPVTKAADSINLWNFDLKDKDTISVPIEISVEQPPAGYQSVPLRFSLPFFAERGQPYSLSTAVANDPPNDPEGVFPFLREMSTPQTTFRNSFVLYQRARLLWKTREEALRSRTPNSDDVALAYWMLYAVADLSGKYYYKPDETVWRTADWIANLPDEARLYTRAKRDTISTLLDQLRSIDASFFNAMILKLEADRSSKRDATCARFKRFDSDFAELTPDEKTRTDPNGTLDIKIKENVTWCAAKIAIGGAGSLTETQLDSLRSAAGSARTSLEKLSGDFQSGRNANLVRQNIQIIESYVGAKSQ
ncbi:hypothetical protein ACC720_35025 [Rhizobium ruizarguesonis]